MALEAKVKIEGAKFLKRDRALEEDKKFMARTTAGTKQHGKLRCLRESKKGAGSFLIDQSS